MGEEEIERKRIYPLILQISRDLLNCKTRKARANACQQWRTLSQLEAVEKVGDLVQHWTRALCKLYSGSVFWIIVLRKGNRRIKDIPKAMIG